MAVRRKRRWISGAFSALVGLICALVLCAVFYGTIVYQHEAAGVAPMPTSVPLLQELEQLRAAATAVPIRDGADVASLFPGRLMAFEEEGATIVQEWANDVAIGRQNCRVVTRVYLRANGMAVSVMSATPAAYLEILSEPACQPQLITGFVLDDLDALFVLRGQTSVLAARDGDYVYMLEAVADEQTLYALGASARRAP